MSEAFTACACGHLRLSHGHHGCIVDGCVCGEFARSEPAPAPVDSGRGGPGRDHRFMADIARSRATESCNRCGRSAGHCDCTTEPGAPAPAQGEVSQGPPDTRSPEEVREWNRVWKAGYDAANRDAGHVTLTEARQRLAALEAGAPAPAAPFAAVCDKSPSCQCQRCCELSGDTPHHALARLAEVHHANPQPETPQEPTP